MREEDLYNLVSFFSVWSKFKYDRWVYTLYFAGYYKAHYELDGYGFLYLQGWWKFC